ncbi:ParB/RepB/Spo0J family partition protein [Streptomyces mayteni]
MSKADKLGPSASFGQARSVSARRVAISAATTAPTTSAEEPPSMPLKRISLNPDNPREEIGDVSELAASLREHGQKQACLLMSRKAYLAANPDREGDLEAEADYVVIDGNRRLVAAREAGLATIKVTVDDTLGSTPDEILESSLVANIHRKAFEPLEEAKALQELLAIHGTQEKLATRLHRSQGWVSQRLALLSLTPELQRRLVEENEPVELLRRVGKKPAEQQEEELERLRQEHEQRSVKKKERRRLSHKPGADAPQVPPAQEAAPAPRDEPPGETEGSHYGVMNSAAPQEDLPRLPWDAPDALDRLLRQHMTEENRLTLAKLLAG